MGYLVPTPAVIHVLGLLNLRFSEGDAIQLMVALQREFKMFGDAHPLRSSFPLLGLMPSGEEEQARWLKYLDRLYKFASDKAGVNGHDRIRSALRENLEGEGYPVTFMVHGSRDEKRVTVTIDDDLVLTGQRQMTISVPTTPARRRAKARRAPPGIARKSRPTG